MAIDHKLNWSRNQSKLSQNCILIPKIIIVQIGNALFSVNWPKLLPPKAASCCSINIIKHFFKNMELQFIKL